MTEYRFGERRYALYGNVPERGDMAPDFTLVGTDLKDTSLSNWRGRRKILLPVTSVELPSTAEVSRRLLELIADDAETSVIVISMDAPFALKRFVTDIDSAALTALSGIRSAGFEKNYGVGVRDGLLKDFYGRAVIVIDENDNVLYAANLADDEAEPNYAGIAKALGIDN